jgi:beta-glucosidase
MSLNGKFASPFVWGAATASYQIEGATELDGRGRCVWDEFALQPGKVLNNDDGRRACDHYNLYPQDVALMKEIGLDAYRFSLAWPRILPSGEGKINPQGLAFYDRLIDELLENNLVPWVTLFHWDLPQALQDKYRGWLSKEVAARFADYAYLVSERYSDRVSNWFTINEIRCFTTLAHREDYHAPGGRLPEKDVNQTIHNALLGHGLAVQAIRSATKQTARIGLVENLDTFWPIIDTPENIAAAKQAWRDANAAILLPTLDGKYSTAYLELLGADAPEFTPEEMKIIASPCDFIGYNYYTGIPVRANVTSQVELHGKKLINPGYEYLKFSSDYPRTDMGWPITPKAIYYALKFTQEEYGHIPLYITENGMAAADKEESTGEINDLSRVEYLRTHLVALAQAQAEGVNLRGYFVWSLLDNYEWTLGYTKRFGITRVNYTTMERTLKLSGKYYAQMIAQYQLAEQTLIAEVKL